QLEVGKVTAKRLKSQITERAQQLGFDACAFTTAAPPDHAAHFERWLAAGMHGEMGYLERNAAKRVDPSEILPEAKTVIALAVSYHAAGSSVPGAGARAGEIESEAKSGLVARYAQYDDYHSVIGERLQALTKFVGELGGPKTRSLWYVD